MALILHPFKQIRPGLTNCLSQEMFWLDNLLFNNDADFDYSPGDLANHDEIAIIGHGSGDSPFFAELIEWLKIKPKGKLYFCQYDPDYSVCLNEHYPIELFTNRLQVLTCYSHYRAMSALLTSKRQDCWLQPSALYMPAWVNEFYNRCDKYVPTIDELKARQYDVAYAGFARSDYRHKRIHALIGGEAISSITCGYKEGEHKLQNNVFLSRCTSQESLAFQNRARFALVVGDPAYAFLGLYAQRVMQAWASNSVALIDRKFFLAQDRSLYVLNELFVQDAEQVLAMQKLEPKALQSLIAIQHTLLESAYLEQVTHFKESL